MSIDYNRNICLQTVRWAMVDWLDDVHVNGLWGVCLDPSIYLIGLLNYAGRMLYAPISR